jgi:hypothetical protein
LTFEERGKYPSSVRSLLSQYVRRGGGELVEVELPDVETKTIRIVRTEASTNAPARPLERGFRCWRCQDYGVIGYTLKAPFQDREIDYSYVARCLCTAASRVSQSIPTFEQIFGAWQRRPGDPMPTTEPRTTETEYSPNPPTAQAKGVLAFNARPDQSRAWDMTDDLMRDD